MCTHFTLELKCVLFQNIWMEGQIMCTVVLRIEDLSPIRVFTVAKHHDNHSRGKKDSEEVDNFGPRNKTTTLFTILEEVKINPTNKMVTTVLLTNVTNAVDVTQTPNMTF